MKHPNRWTLSITDDTWQTGRVTAEGPQSSALEASAESTDEERATALATSLKALGYRGESILLAIPSAWCFACRVPVDSPAHLRDRKSLLFDLESQAPVAAEELVADFVGHRNFALGVAAPLEQLAPLVAALEEKGVAVQSIVPSAHLAGSRLAQTRNGIKDGVLLLGDGDRLDMLVLEQGKLADWFTMPQEPRAILRELQRMALEETSIEQPVHGFNLNPDMHEAISAALGERFTLLESEPIDFLALSEADAILAGKRLPWVDLRRDSLAAGDPWKPLRAELRRAFAAAAVLFLAISGACLWRTHGLSTQVDHIQSLQAAVFQEVFPGQSIPVGVRSRLEGERQKLRAMTSASSELPADRSALILLRELLAALPENLRCRAQELRFDRERLSLEAEVCGHGDAEVIAAGLRSRGFEVDSPRTEQLSGGAVGIRLQARFNPKGGAKP